MRKLLPLVALVGLSACTVYPDGKTVIHSPAPTYVAPVYSAPVYVAPPPRVYYSPYYVPRHHYVAPYYGPRYRR